MLERLQKFFTKKLAFIISGILAIGLLVDTVFYCAGQLMGDYFLSFIGDIFIIACIVGFGIYNAKGQTKKASKMFYLIIGYTVYETTFLGILGFEGAADFFKCNSTVPALSYLFYGISDFLVLIGLLFFITYKISEKRRIWIANVAFLFGLLAFVAGLASTVFSFVGLFVTEPWPFYELLDSILQTILPIVVMCQCVLSTNREEDFDLK